MACDLWLAVMRADKPPARYQAVGSGVPCVLSSDRHGSRPERLAPCPPGRTRRADDQRQVWTLRDVNLLEG